MSGATNIILIRSVRGRRAGAGGGKGGAMLGVIKRLWVRPMAEPGRQPRKANI